MITALDIIAVVLLVLSGLQMDIRRGTWGWYGLALLAFANIVYPAL